MDIVEELRNIHATKGLTTFDHTVPFIEACLKD